MRCDHDVLSVVYRRRQQQQQQHHHHTYLQIQEAEEAKVPLDRYNPLLYGCRNVEHYERLGMIAQVCMYVGLYVCMYVCRTVCM